MMKKEENIVSKILGTALIILAAISLLVFFDNLPSFFSSGYTIRTHVPPTEEQAPTTEVQPAVTGIAQANLRLLQLDDKHRNGPPEIQQSILPQLTAAAQQRREVLLSLMDENVSAVFDNALSSDIRSVLSPEIHPYLEQDVDSEGNLTVNHADYFGDEKGPSTAHSMNFILLNTFAGERLQLYFADEGPTALNGYKAKVHGIKVDNKIAVKSSASPDFEATNAGQKGDTPTGHTVKKVAIILFNFQSNPYQQFSPDGAREAFSITNAYYQNTSFGLLSLEGIRNISGDVFGWYTIPDVGCDTWQLDSLTQVVDQAAMSAGVNLTGYSNKVYITNFGLVGNCNACYAFSSALLMGLSTHCMIHELGHNFGLPHHANGYACYNATFDSQDINYDKWNPDDDTIQCKRKEYGDGYSVMGSGYTISQLNNYEKGRLNWFVASNTLDVTSEGDYTIYPLEYPTTGVQALRIAGSSIRNDDANIYSYYLEFRQPAPFDNIDPLDNVFSKVSSGVSVRSAPADYSVGDNSLLIDTRPGSPPDSYIFKLWADLFDGSIQVGQTFEDRLAGISVKTVSIIPNVSATVHIAFPNFPDTFPPRYIYLNTYSNFLSGVASIRISATDNVGVTKVELYADGTLVGSTTSPVSRKLPDYYSVAWDTRTVTDGSHNLTAKAYDAAGNVGKSKALFYGQGTVIVDNTLPTVTETLPLTAGSTVKAASVVTIAATASDSSGVAKVVFYVGTKVICTAFTSPYTCSWTIPKGAGKTFQLQAKAYDRAGNVAASPAITVTST